MSEKVMNELIARLEKATGPSDALDEEIFSIVMGYKKCCGMSMEGGLLDEPFWIARELDQAIVGRAPAYTFDTDIARKLLHTGWRFVLDAPGCDSITPHRASCKIYCQDNYAFSGADKALNSVADGATAAIAICIAALKARASQTP